MESCRAAAQAASPAPTGFIQLGVVADLSDANQAMPMPAALPTPRGAGLTLAERAGVIEIDLPDGVRVRVDGGVNEKALRRVLAAVKGLG